MITSSSSKKPGESEDSLEMWRSISKSWKILNREVERAVGSTGLSLTELRILRMLSEHEPSPMTRITKELLITPGATTSLIDGLETQGFVERVRSEDDRRVITIKITGKGETSLRKALALHRQFVKRKFRVLTRRQRLELVELLDKLSRA